MNQEERMYVVGNQKITLGDIIGQKVLDIGGGGQGIIYYDFKVKY